MKPLGAQSARLKFDAYAKFESFIQSAGFSMDQRDSEEFVKNQKLRKSAVIPTCFAVENFGHKTVRASIFKVKIFNFGRISQ